MTVSQSSAPSSLTPKHVRAARALMAWSQQDLAKSAGVAISTVADFERGQRTPVANNAQAIRGALEGAGVRFLPTGAVIGPAVPAIKASDRPGAPIRWVDAEDLSKWADRTDGALSMPTLIAHLIRATHRPAIQLRFPADEGVRYAGWDGQTKTETKSDYVPEKDAGWEIGVQRSKIANKADEDYRKRTAVSDPFNPTNATFVFVTPRHWPQKHAWVKARQTEGAWREVRAYDADDLVHWIEQAPAVGLWLATRLGKRPTGIRELDELWEEWSLATQWPLTEDLVLSDRDQDATEVRRWLRGEPSVLSLQATTTEEVVAFFHATLSELPDDLAAEYRALTLVATTASAARALANAPAPLIILLTDPEGGIAQVLAGRGHYVLQAYDERPVTRGNVRTLARPSREGIASALTAAGIPEPRAKTLAHDSARNLAVLRRLIPGAPGRLPRWAEKAPPCALLAALLAGGWDEGSEADRARLSELATQPYETVIAALAPYVGEFDSPLQKIGSTWRIASPSDAWFLLASNLTSADITRFEAVAHAVLGSADPRFELDPDDRWKAGVRGIHPEYSGMLRQGIGQVLIVLALRGDQVRTVPNASRRADAIVGKLLKDADQRRWWSLSRDFRLLGEASPDAFLTAIEDSLDQNAPPIAALFGHDDGGMFGTEHLSDLMWALESLAWSPDLLPRVTHVLARLDTIDTKPRQYVNGPANSLRTIHLLWNPHTYATLDQRLRALDLIRKRETSAAWKLMHGILPRGYDSSSTTPMPRWRDFTVDKVEVVTYSVMGRGAAAITDRLIADVGLSPARWSELLDRFSDLAPDSAAGLAALEAAEPRITNKTDRVVFWDNIRRVLHHHRQFPSAEWSLPVTVLDRLEAVYDRFAPSDSLERTAWLFQQSVQLPKPPGAGWQTEQRDVDAARREAARAVYAAGGVRAVLSLARLVNSAGYIGKALFDSGLPDAELDEILAVAGRSDDPNERAIAHGLIISLFDHRKESWAAALIARAQGEAWGDAALLTIVRALPVRHWTWDQVARIGGEIETTYWRRAPVFWDSDRGEDVTYAIRKLIGVGRARHALYLAYPRAEVRLPTDLLIEVLKEAERQPFDNDGDANAATMFQYHVAGILELLDERSDVDRNALITLEWKYLAVLEHSRRPAKVLLKVLSEQPASFIQVLSAVFKPKEESGVVEAEPENPEQARAVAHQAYRLLSLWNRLPGSREDGTIDGKVLEAWIKEARSLAKTAGREGIADSKIGEMLSASPLGADSNWPAEPVRDVIELFHSKSLIEGFWVGKVNRRGVTTRGPRDGGELERQEAARYRGWAKEIGYNHPHTAKALDMLAENNEREAIRHDEESERLDWEA
jgi:transcriptional regulator with XRE-family HTH domain